MGEHFVKMGGREKFASAVRAPLREESRETRGREGI